jgi:hypothetical protein
MKEVILGCGESTLQPREWVTNNISAFGINGVDGDIRLQSVVGFYNVWVEI